MNLDAAVALARRGSLYPGVILHGADQESRQAAALELARALLCAAPDEERPCGLCRHCRRVVWPDSAKDDVFHPDFRVLERDLKTSTSVGATRELVKNAQVAPFEARGQVFVIASAETLSGEAANSLLKAVEEPPDTAPRHFLLLAPSQLDLLPTLRSRSLAIYLGAASSLDPEAVDAVGRQFAAAVAAYASGGAPVYLLAAAESLKGAGRWDDPRSGAPWTIAAAAVTRGLDDAAPQALRRRLLALAQALLDAPSLRLRGIPADRILEGLVSRHLAGPRRDAV